MLFGMFIVFALLLIVSLTTGFVYASVNKNVGKVMTPEQCFLVGGQVRGAAQGGSACGEGEEYLGEVEGTSARGACCKL
ncbi:MAG: hypothetical protein U1C53_03385 [Candidatus Veblenbacteria bacterium]|nr:hypothetical protein [Candidatus Veblenbacteria bacterium]MDZ4230157.1 hypothetical protein [Candidatus Veblenbacteria bacterium]